MYKTVPETSPAVWSRWRPPYLGHVVGARIGGLQLHPMCCRDRSPCRPPACRPRFGEPSREREAEPCAFDTRLISAQRSNGLNSSASFSAGIPAPVSSTLMRRRPFLHVLTRQRDASTLAVDLIAFETRLRRLIEPLAVRADMASAVALGSAGRRSAGAHQRPHEFDDLLITSSTATAPVKETAGRTRSSKYRHLVHQAEQMTARLENLENAFTLIGREVVHVEQLRKAKDGVQRRAQIVVIRDRNSLFARFARSASRRRDVCSSSACFRAVMSVEIPHARTACPSCHAKETCSSERCADPSALEPISSKSIDMPLSMTLRSLPR